MKGRSGCSGSRRARFGLQACCCFDLRAHKGERQAAPEMPVSTSEPISSYGNDALCQITDFHSPNVHWIFQGGNRQDVKAALDWLTERTQALRSIYPKPLLVKEHGMPSGPDPFTEALQSNYWAQVLQRVPNSTNQSVVFFEAFDLPFKTITQQSELASTEAHWGAWDKDRRPKPVLTAFPLQQARRTQ